MSPKPEQSTPQGTGTDCSPIHEPPEPIAICGIGLRLPGGVKDAARFWEVLYNGEDLKSPIPPSRFNSDGFSNARGSKGAIGTRHGYFLDEDLDTLDNSFFSMTKEDLAKMDPQQRKLLEVVQECLDSAGEVDYRGKDIGCYVGTFAEDWILSQARDNQHVGGYNLGGDLMIANRVNYEYDLRGPSVVIKTGCSASLICLHEACRALQHGDATGAIVAGTSLITGPATYAVMAREGVLAPDGSCKTFDAAADGYARGEAINALYVKRLRDAIRDGNPIRAVIRGTGINADGKNQGLMMPNGEAHERLIRKVYAAAQLDPSQTGFVECHGTGTPIGDRIEATAVGNVFGDSGVIIGGVKPNVGHAEGASGITSVIKAVLALEHNTIPPNIKFTNPNPEIPFQEKKLTVPVVPTPWPKDRAARVSINAFGIGGSNAHAIIDSAASYLQDQPKESTQTAAPSTGAQLLVFSANTPSSLERLIQDIKTYLQTQPDHLADVSYTLSQRRQHLTHRAYAVTQDGSCEDVSPIVKAPAAAPPVVMTFSGQGAQWATMGQQLLQSDPGFLKDVQEMDTVLRSLKHPPSWSLQEEICKPIQESQVNTAEISQPLCTAIQVALVNTLARSGIHPSAIIGHSSGEIAGAYAAGVISMTEAIIVAYYRGYVTKFNQLRGGMVAVGLGAEEVAGYLQEGVVVACENSPGSTTISGDLDALDQVSATIRESHPDILVRELKVDMAYHSNHMRPLLQQYTDLLTSETISKDLQRAEPGIPFFSSVKVQRLEKAADFTPEYWGENLTSPVRFYPAVNLVLDDYPQSLFLEIGPHSTLSGPLRQVCGHRRTPLVYTPTMIRNQDCSESLQAAYGQLYQRGVDIDFSACAATGKVLADLPTYPWDHPSSFWHENRISKAWRFRKFGHHATLGQRIPESTSLNPAWRVVLDLEDEPWLADHKIREDIVFPFTGYVSMATEAIHQITGVETGYSIRHMLAHTALVLNESSPVELVTVLRPIKLTDSTDSEAYEFVISSYSNTTWIKHCEGRVQPLRNIRRDTLSSWAASLPLPRQVDPSIWYNIMARVGLVYGPEFRGITNLRSSATECVAECEVRSSEAHQDGPFLAHPADMDCFGQLALAAIAKGAGKNFRQLCVPTLIEEFDVSRGAPVMTGRAWRTSDSLEASVDCDAGGEQVLRIRGMRFTPVEDDSTGPSSPDRHAASRLQWYPDFDFLDGRNLLQAPKLEITDKLLVEELALLCILETAERIQGLETPQEHLHKWRDWLSQEIGRVQDCTYPIVENAPGLAELNRDTRLQRMRDMFAELSATPQLRSLATGIMRICENAATVFTGETDVLELLMRANCLTEAYNTLSFGFGDFVHKLAIVKPNLRILEVGAGTGGTTELVLRSLVRPGVNPPYMLYTYTDISAGFFGDAAVRFAYAPNMEYKVLDISRDPVEQGFTPESYDLILAANVLHATSSLHDTLINLQPLLRPQGYLLLNELCAAGRAPGFVFGVFSGWWLGEADDRKWEPYVQVERWDQELKKAGFTGVDYDVLDAPQPFNYCAAVVAQTTLGQTSLDADRRVTVLCDEPDQGISNRLITDLKAQGYTVEAGALGQPLGDNVLAIATLDLEAPFFESITAHRLQQFQELVHTHPNLTLLWLLPPAQVRCDDPRYAYTPAVFKNVRSELDRGLYTLEIDPAEPEFCSLATKVFQKICRANETDDALLPDREFVVDQGVVKIGRYEPFSLEDELASKTGSQMDQVKALEVGRPGLLETLHWVESRRSTEVGDDEVLVAPRAAGMNFRDILVAMGVLDYALGIELSGIVTEVGKNVTHVQPGDRVCGIAAGGCFSTSVVLKGSLVSKIPDSLSFNEAATMPSVLITCLRALIEVGEVQRGQTVLIHSAAGGIGNAAIQLCRMIGAEIFVTCGSERKADYLTSTWNIPRDHIFSSRDISFVEDVRRMTDGRGVDLVLNSLAGELLHASWQCVAEFGRLVELGKRDLTGFGKLDLQPFLLNRSYCCVDLAHLAQARPEAVGRMLDRVLDLYRAGHVQPITPIAVFEAADIEQCFRHMQKGDHIGKAVVAIPEDSSTIPSVLRGTALQLDPNASYLITGGFGGIGRSIASWMVDRGATELVFLSRSAGVSERDRPFIQELESMGCAVCTVAGKVNQVDDVRAAIRAASKTIKGVFHLATVFYDSNFLQLTHEEWVNVVSPKVDGAWILHRELLDAKLDFFVLTSSMAAVFETPGQANYAAANAFLESFVQYRRRQGHPASVVSICPVDDVGVVAQNPEFKRKLHSQGLIFLPERELLEYIELTILNSPPASVEEEDTLGTAGSWASYGHVVMGMRSAVPLTDPDCPTTWRRDRRLGTYHNVRVETEDTGSASSNPIKVFLRRVAHDPGVLTEPGTVDFLAMEIGRKLFKFMIKDEEDVEIGLSLAQIGMDSLMAIELRRWWKVTFGLPISVLEIMNSGTLQGLGQAAARGLHAKLASPE